MQTMEDNQEEQLMDAPDMGGSVEQEGLPSGL